MQPIKLTDEYKEMKLSDNFALKEFVDPRTGNVLIDPEVVQEMQKLRDHANSADGTAGMREQYPGKEYTIRPLVTPEKDGNRAAYRQGASGPHGDGLATDFAIFGPDGNRVSEQEGARLILDSGAFSQGRVGSYVNTSGQARYHGDTIGNTPEGYWVQTVPDNGNGTRDTLDYFLRNESDDWLQSIGRRNEYGDTPRRK